MGNFHVRLAVANREAVIEPVGGPRGWSAFAAAVALPGARRSGRRPFGGRLHRRPGAGRRAGRRGRRGARATGGSRRWRRARCRPERAQTELDTLARSYREADFLRCLTRVEHALDPDQLLQRGHRAEAAQAGTLAAACALGAGDEARARDLLRRLSVRELVEPRLLRGTTPAFQRLADEERQAAQRRGWVAVDVRSEPDGASIHVNGVERCPAAPCRVHLLRGEHVLVAKKLGHRSRTLTPVLEGDHAVTMKLDPASADETRGQLAAALGAGVDPSAVEIPRAAASAFGVDLLVLVWTRNWQMHAAAYQAGSRDADARRGRRRGRPRRARSPPRCTAGAPPAAPKPRRRHAPTAFRFRCRVSWSSGRWASRCVIASNRAGVPIAPFETGSPGHRLPLAGRSRWPDFRLSACP